MRQIAIVFLLSIIALATSKVIDVLSCKNNYNSDEKCEFISLGGGPCITVLTGNCANPEDADDHMSFQFKPRFNATRLTSKVNRYMARGSAQDWVFDACNDTTCPVIYGTKYNYYSSKKYIENLPVGNYTYKWELFDKNDYHNMCCVQVIVAVGQENISPNIHNATDNETDYTYDPQHS